MCVYVRGRGGGGEAVRGERSGGGVMMVHITETCKRNETKYRLFLWAYVSKVNFYCNPAGTQR